MCFSSPFPNLISLRENARFFAECGAVHVFEECNASSANGGLTPELKAYLAGKVLWNPYISGEEYRRHIMEFLAAFYGKGWQEILRVLDIEYKTTANHCVGGFFGLRVDLGATLHILLRDEEQFVPYDDICPFFEQNYIPLPYQPVVREHHLVDFLPHLDEIKACYDRAFALAETDAERHHLEISRFAITFLDLFCTPHIKGKMTKEEQKAYENEVAKFYKDKERFHCHYNVNTSNAMQR